MVVLSAGILTRNKTVLNRQFVEMNKLRVDGLYSAFPKLVDSERGKDHTYIETESVRYIYQPMEQLFLVLVTNKASNILEDIETLRLLAKTVQDACKHVQICEDAIIKNAYDIIFAFDETISFGYRESVTLSQVKQFLEMESTDEKLQQRIEQTKINEAKELAKKKAMELDKMRINNAKMNQNNFVENETLSRMDQAEQEGSADTAPAPVSMPTPQITYNNFQEDTNTTNAIQAAMPKRGMQLGRKKTNPLADLTAQMSAASANPSETTSTNPAAAATTNTQSAIPDDAQPAAAINPLQEPISVFIDETVEASLGLEGGLNQDAVVQGKFEVTVYDPSKADLASFKLSPQDSKFKYRLHPNMNKQSHASNNCLEIRDPEKKFRAGAAAALLKWQMKTSDEEEIIPLAVTCWPTPQADGTTSVIVEYELRDDSKSLENVQIRIPCPPGSGEIKSTESGEARVLGDAIAWVVPSIDGSNSTGTLEFLARCNADSLVPIQVRAKQSTGTVCPMDIQQCYHQSTQEPIKYAIKRNTEFQLTIGN